jgi:hypothetical protein
MLVNVVIVWSLCLKNTIINYLVESQFSHTQGLVPMLILHGLYEYCKL